MTERTLVLVKPDGVQRLLVGRILTRFEERGLKLVGLKLVQVSRDLAERHYAVHRERPFFGSLVEFITSSPLVAFVARGARTRSRSSGRWSGRPARHEAAPGTIRGDFALETAQNLIHASDGPETAAAELALWFRAGRAARLRARHRPLGARPGRLSRLAGRRRPPDQGEGEGAIVSPGSGSSPVGSISRARSVPPPRAVARQRPQSDRTPRPTRHREQGGGQHQDRRRRHAVEPPERAQVVGEPAGPTPTAGSLRRQASAPVGRAAPSARRGRSPRSAARRARAPAARAAAAPPGGSWLRRPAVPRWSRRRAPRGRRGPADPGMPTMAMPMAASAMASTGDRRAQPRRSGSQRVP